MKITVREGLQRDIIEVRIGNKRRDRPDGWSLMLFPRTT